MCAAQEPDRVNGKAPGVMTLIVLRNPLRLGPGKECGFGVFRGGGAFGECLTSSIQLLCGLFVQISMNPND